MQASATLVTGRLPGARMFLSKEEADRLTFAELATALRAAIEEKRTSRASLVALLEVLESKLPRPPTPPVLEPSSPTPVLPERPQPLHLAVQDEAEHRDTAAKFRAMIELAIVQRDSRTNPKRKAEAQQRILKLRAERDAALRKIIVDAVGEAGLKRLQRNEALLADWMIRVQRISTDYERTSKRVREISAGRLQPYREALQAWQETVALQARIVTNLRAETATPGHQVARLSWVLLPDGVRVRETPSYQEGLRARFPSARILTVRLRYARSMGPSQGFVGRESWDGYHAFLYKRGKQGQALSVLLESPIEGNAAYILGHNWESLSRLTKAELLRMSAKKVIRVVHEGDWQERIRRALKTIPPQHVAPS